MIARNGLLEKLPGPVDEALKVLASNLRTARLRRNLSVQDVADRIGVSRRLVTDAERGKPSTGVAVYVAMLWTLGMVEGLAAVADPRNDKVGMAASLGRERKRAGRSGRDDF